MWTAGGDLWAADLSDGALLLAYIGINVPTKGLHKTKNAFLVAEVTEAMSGEEIKEKIFNEEYKGGI